MQPQTRRVQPAVVLLTVSLIFGLTLLVRPIRQTVFSFVSAGSAPLASVSFSLLERLGWSTSIRQSADTAESLRVQLDAATRHLSATTQELQARQTADQLTGYLNRVTLPTIPGSVIGYSPDPGIQSLVINIGQREGVRTGQAVITGDGWMIGKVSTVHETTSVVILLTDAQSIALASIQNTPLSQGVVRGDRGLAVKMDLIPKNDTVEVGQPVVTSGLEPGIPPDLLIGSVAAVEQRAGEVFQRARVTVPIRYGRVRQVAIVNL